MAEVLRATTFVEEMADTVEPLGLSNSFTNLNMNMTTVQGGHQGSQSYVVRLPRRAFSCIDQGIYAQHTQRKQHIISAPQTPPRQPTDAVVDIRSQLQRRDALLAAAAAAAAVPRIPRTARLNPPIPKKIHQQQQAATAAIEQRPAMPTPQRSYSVMDVEPVPLTHQPGTALTLPDLPAELHYAIFDLLDPIDSTCLGLASRQFYAIFRHLHIEFGGKNNIPLGARREGPNDMEWVWRHAGPFVSSSPSKGGNGSQVGGNKQNTLAVLSPRGQVYCRKCRTARCELHKHIRDFFDGDQEYCEVAQKFGRPAADDARPICYRSSPRHPHRCGRHTRQQRAVRLV
ncbi:hypothetical protein MGN70_008322 [Eutypa lata]|nr:hypothetical protein MGN70_008322 [Eutypa lata]